VDLTPPSARPDFRRPDHVSRGPPSDFLPFLMPSMTLSTETHSPPHPCFSGIRVCPSPITVIELSFPLKTNCSDMYLPPLYPHFFCQEGLIHPLTCYPSSLRRLVVTQLGVKKKPLTPFRGVFRSAPTQPPSQLRAQFANHLDNSPEKNNRFFSPPLVVPPSVVRFS